MYCWSPALFLQFELKLYEFVKKRPDRLADILMPSLNPWTKKAENIHKKNQIP